MVKKKKFLICSSLLGVLLFSTPILTTQLSNNSVFKSFGSSLKTENNASNVDSSVSQNNKSDVKPVVPTEFLYQMPVISVDTGPIVYYGSKITSLDWFGAERWSHDFSDQKTYHSYFPGKQTDPFVKWPYGAFTNWAVDKKNNVLWVLTNSKHSTRDVSAKDNVPPQHIIKIDTITGKIQKSFKLPGFTDEQTNTGQYGLYYQIQLLDSGKLVIFSQGSSVWGYNWVFDPNEKDANKQFVFSDASKFKDNEKINQVSEGKHEAATWSRYVVPVAPNVNILVVVDRSTTNDNKSKATGDLHMFLVDDNYKRLNITDPQSPWYNGVVIKNIWTYGTDGWAYRYGDKFSKAFFKTVNGRTYFTAFNKFYVFYPDYQTGYGVRFSEHTFENKGAISSYTIDPSENLFYKLVDDNKIYKLQINGTSYDNTTFNSYLYYDLTGNSEPAIKDNAKNYLIFNIPGYSGSIMMINSKIISNTADKKEAAQDGQAIQTNHYGVSVAIVENTKDPGKGDTKGLLNTDKAFTKSSDFTIPENVLKNKLPSEINRRDLEISNDGFLTNNNDKDENGNNKYPQFIKEIMNDNNNANDNLKVTANIDQIPWFVNNGIMPGNIPPLKITKTFKTGQQISDRVSWKNSELDYDFKNTLPSKITLQDIQRFDPFDINISSQQTRISGINYPQKTYSFSEANDENGTIKIKATVKYLPIDVEATEANIKTETFENIYTIFKSSSDKKFNFVGTTNNNKEDIKNIPQLKNLSESNLLPSSFDANDSSSILRFINTDTSSGFPISKMNFTVTPDDNLGTLTISGSLPPNYYPGQQNQTFTKTYEGLNKISDYNFVVKQSNGGFDKKKYRPSEINEQIVYDNFITYKGFNSSDLSLDLIPNDETGDLTIKINLESNYPSIIATNSEFKQNENNFVREEKISGFKTNQEYGTQYEVKFIEDNDKSLDGIKKYTPKQIQQSILATNTGSKLDLTINGEKITTEEQFAKAVIKSLGTSLPTKNQLNQNNFEYNIYYNDPNGEITVKLTFKNVEGTSGNLVFIQRYTGFAKGNQVTTDDILSFKTQSKLMSDYPDIKNSLPSELAKKLNDKNNRQEEIKKYISYYSGAYATGIEANNFTLEVTSDDIYGYLTIKIIFDSTFVTNKDSLLSYTTTYSGFATE